MTTNGPATAAAIFAGPDASLSNALLKVTDPNTIGVATQAYSSGARCTP